MPHLWRSSSPTYIHRLSRESATLLRDFLPDIDGFGFSNPTVKARAERLFRPGGNSLDCHLLVETIASDYSLLTLKHCAFGVGLKNAYIGETLKDICNIRAKTLTTAEEVMPLINTARLRPNLPYIASSNSTLPGWTTRVQWNGVTWMAVESLKLNPSKQLKDDMDALGQVLTDINKAKAFPDDLGTVGHQQVRRATGQGNGMAKDLESDNSSPIDILIMLY
ncbi:hypothetical protein GE09DRAFT_1268226 [Coniochaeta sp. 2T2.1]|nr:hypothetical protein GE09DRAFT_1268226 [Coniochaeta sp. 2T2.1]